MAYANSADPGQTAPEGAVWSGSALFAIPVSILRNKLHKKHSFGQNSLEWRVRNFRTFTLIA